MSNMKDYMMWLDDRGIASWASPLHNELIVPDEVDIYAEEIVNQYQNDTAWHRPGLEEDDRDDMIEDDSEDDLVDDDIGDELDLDHQMGLVSDLLESLFSGTPTAIRFAETLELDHLEELWNTRTVLRELMDYNDSTEHLFEADGGLTGEAQNYLHDLDAKGEFV